MDFLEHLRGPVRFIQLEDRHAAIAWREPRLPANVVVVVQQAAIAVVEEHEREDASRVWTQENRVVLSIIPLDGSLARGEREIAIRAKMPQDSPVARSISVVDLDDPILIAHGK